MPEQYTKTPWFIVGEMIVADDGSVNGKKVIATCYLEANARFIVKAVNSHDKLVETLRNIIERLDEGLALGEKLDLAPARQALKLATES